jgi:hypothetical protein
LYLKSLSYPKLRMNLKTLTHLSYLMYQKKLMNPNYPLNHLLRTNLMLQNYQN